MFLQACLSSFGLLRLHYFIWGILAPVAIQAAISHGPAIADGTGARGTNGVRSMLVAGAQSGGLGLSTAPGGAQHAAGFLQVFQLNEGQDTDGDGLANEVDPDNDGDGLSDEREATGAAFVPVTRTDVNGTDTDQDGFSDASEVIAGTDPTDAESRLTLDVRPFGYWTSTPTFETNPPPPFEWTNDVLHVTAVDVIWPARAGRTYRIYRSGNLRTDPFVPVYTNVAAGPGAGPWQVVTNQWGDSNLLQRMFYRIEVQP